MSNTFASPGVYITESLLTPPPVQTTTSPSVAGFAGEHWRGPVAYAVQCNRWQDFVNYFGGFNPNATPVLANPWLPYAVYEFFNNGGQSCYINRIQAASPSGAAATVTLTDSSASPQPSTLKLTAGCLGINPTTNPNVGTWGNNLYAQVTQPQLLTSSATFTLTIYLGGTSPGNIVESWNNLSMVPTNARYAITVLNSATAGSKYVVATDLSDATTAPNNTPGIQGPTQFTGGIDTGDPSTTDKENAWTYTNAASAFDVVPGVLNCNAPGETNSAVLASAIGYCAGGASGRPYTFLVIDPVQGATVASVVSYMQTLQGLDNSSYAALYYPWTIVVNPASSSLQATTTIPPGGLVLGQMCSIDTQFGPWYAPAGTATVLSGVVSTERTLTPGNYSTLNLANINALKSLPNGQVLIWGARTMLTQITDVYVPIRRTLNYIEAQLSSLLQYAVFQPNDAQLWSTILATVNGFLQKCASRNAFSGQTAAQQYYAICDTTNNTPTTIAQGVVNVTIGLALNYPAEFIQLNIQQFQNSGVTTTQANI